MVINTPLLVLGLAISATAVNWDDLSPVPSIDYSTLPYIPLPTTDLERAAADDILVAHFSGTQLEPVFNQTLIVTNIPNAVTRISTSSTSAARTGVTCWTTSSSPLTNDVIHASNYLYKFGSSDEYSANCKMVINEVYTRLLSWGTAKYNFCRWPRKFNINCVMPAAFAAAVSEDCSRVLNGQWRASERYVSGDPRPMPGQLQVIRA